MTPEERVVAVLDRPRLAANANGEHTSEAYMAAWNALSIENRAKAAVCSSSTSGGSYLVTPSGIVFGAFSNA